MARSRSAGGRRRDRGCAKLGIPPIASFHVISADHGRARVRASSQAGTSVVLDFSRVDGRWLLDGLPEPANH
jgi:hypothetical protein